MMPRSTGPMNRTRWRRARRTALVVACVGYFATLAVIGQVAEGDPPPPAPPVLVGR